MGWLGAIVEDVPQVTAASGADHFGAIHTVALVSPNQSSPAIDLTVEARPAGMAVELVGTAENNLPTSNASELALLMEIPELP